MDFKFSFNVSDNDEETDSQTPQKEHADKINKSLKSIENKPAKTYKLSSIKNEWISSDSDYLYTFETLTFNNGFQLNYVQSGIENDVVGENEISNPTDLIPKVYEGGLKIWECSLDLVEFCLENAINFKNKSVLDLGCGIGITGLCAAQLGAKHIVFQDFNDFVLFKNTGPSVLLQEYQISNNEKNTNPSINDIITGESLSVNEDKYTFLSGSWDEGQKIFDHKCDIILTSETIYDYSNYPSIAGFLRKALKQEGVVYLAAKSFYFGVGGGTKLFIDFINEQGYFKIETVKTIDSPLQREILKLELL